MPMGGSVPVDAVSTGLVLASLARLARPGARPRASLAG